MIVDVIIGWYQSSLFTLESYKIDRLAESEAKGKLIGRIQLLQQVLSVVEMTGVQLCNARVEQLQVLADRLQSKFDQQR